MWISGIFVILFLQKKAPVTKWRKQREAEELALAEGKLGNGEEEEEHKIAAGGLTGVAEMGKVDEGATRQP